MFQPLFAADPPDEEQAADVEFDAHGNPIAGQSVDRGQEDGRNDPDQPHAPEVEPARDKGVAGTDAGAVGDDGGGVAELGESFDPKDFGAEGDDIRVYAEHAHELRRDEPHDDGEHAHHADAEGHGDPREAADQFPPSGSETLSDQGGGGVAHAVSRHIDETFRRDGEGVRSNGDGSQRGHDDGAGDMGSAHDHILDPHRPGDAEGVFQADAGGTVGYASFMDDGQLLGADEQEPEHQAGGDEFRQSGAEGRSFYAHAGPRNGDAGDFPGREDQQEIEDDVQHAHQHVQQAGKFHVSAALEHAAAEKAELHRGQKQDIGPEIRGGFPGDVRTAAEPAGKGVRDGQAGQDEQKTEQGHAGQALAQNFPGAHKIIGTDQVRDLDGKTLRSRHGEAAEDPGGRGDQTDGGGGTGAEAADHGCIDELEKDGGELGEDGRSAEQERQADLLPQRKGKFAADAAQQEVLILRIAHNTYKFKDKTGIFEGFTAFLACVQKRFVIVGKNLHFCGCNR